MGNRSRAALASAMLIGFVFVTPAAAQYGSGHQRGGSRGYPPAIMYPERHPGYRTPARDPAFERGYAEGYELALQNARNRDWDDPVRLKRYRKADRGYGRWYGPKDRYRDLYRAGFREGYELGYRDGLTRWSPGRRVRGAVTFVWRW